MGEVYHNERIHVPSAGPIPARRDDLGPPPAGIYSRDPNEEGRTLPSVRSGTLRLPRMHTASQISANGIHSSAMPAVPLEITSDEPGLSSHARSHP